MDDLDQQDSPELTVDPRTGLADWANNADEWLRYIVRQVLATARPLPSAEIDDIYELFKQEKGLDERDLPPVSALEVELGAVVREAPLTLQRVREVRGVNALTSGATIDFNSSLTILFGENGTGKTGYARILKALAASRTADEILPNVHEEEQTPPSAKVAYQLGGVDGVLDWSGETGKAPFTRMSVFDSPAVNFHVDEELEYVYTPATLALFTHVSNAVQALQERVASEVATLSTSSATLLNRFKRGSSVYPKIETLGASTDLAALVALQLAGPEAEARLADLTRSVGALQSNAAGAELALARRVWRVLNAALVFSQRVEALDREAYRQQLDDLRRVSQDYAAFRAQFFAAAHLPAEPDEAWQTFIAAGEAYRLHLEEAGAESPDACLYCRQPLSEQAADLIKRYADYLDDAMASSIQGTRASLQSLGAPLADSPWQDVETFLGEQIAPEGSPDYVLLLGDLALARQALLQQLADHADLDQMTLSRLDSTISQLRVAAEGLASTVEELERRVSGRETALAETQRDLLEHEARLELSKVMPEITSRVSAAKRADQLRLLHAKLPTVLRQVTELSKAASELMINQNFETLFAEECAALRAPALRLEFLGRRGKAQRRKVMAGKHRPSRVLSEGEQKVLAIADFLAEARLTGITAPVVFDDPATSLDHRRINEVADRVASLAADNQVIVFTHDILFATYLLARFEKTTRCSYFQVTDEGGKGQVTRASGPRWDTIKNITKQLNETIQAANKAEGETRAALVRTGYDWLRSWCEVFTEMELLQEVTQRYQPNVKMTMLPRIKAEALPEAIETVVDVFENACRYIDGHSQPLVTLAVAPTLAGLEADWSRLQDCRKAYLVA